MNAPIAHKPPAGWIVTFHAAERYCARVSNDMTPLAAMIALRALLPNATLLQDPTPLGQQRWLLPGVDAVVVAKPDPKAGAHVAVTVLGPHEMYEAEAIPEVVAAYQRATAPRTASASASSTAKVIAVPSTTKPTAKELAADNANLRDNAKHLNASIVKWKARAVEAERLVKVVAEKPKHIERMRAHVATTEADSNLKRSLLRVAVIALREAGANGALATLEAMSAGITGDHFCYPERFTKEERQAAAAAREVREQGI